MTDPSQPDWQQIRAEFPALANWTFLNTATFGQMPRSGAEAAARHFAAPERNRADEPRRAAQTEIDGETADGCAEEDRGPHVHVRGSHLPFPRVGGEDGGEGGKFRRGSRPPPGPSLFYPWVHPPLARERGWGGAARPRTLTPPPSPPSRGGRLARWSPHTR